MACPLGCCSSLGPGHPALVTPQFSSVAAAQNLKVLRAFSGERHLTQTSTLAFPVVSSSPRAPWRDRSLVAWCGESLPDGHAPGRASETLVMTHLALVLEMAGPWLFPSES